jgi:molybdopterin converting factor small subunit
MTCSCSQFSTASASSGEAKGNPSKTEYELDLSHYSNVREFNLVLESIASECTSNKKDSGVDVISRASIAEALVRKLDAENATGEGSFKADISTYNILMKVWARAAQTLAEGRGRGDINQVIHAMDDVPEELTFGGVYTAKDAAHRAAMILEDLEQNYLTGKSEVAPNTFGYNIVLDGLGKCQSKDSPQEVLKIFEKMKLWNTKGVLDPNHKKGEDEEEYINTDASQWQAIKPDSITYSVIMETLGQSKDPEVVAKVDDLLEELEAEYEKTNDYNLKPVTRVYNAAINAYLKHAGTPQKARDASSKGWIYAKKVHSILNALTKKWEDTGDESYQPDITTYTMVIDAYGRCNDVAAVERGEILFEKVYKKWIETGDEKLKPSSRTFTVVSILLFCLVGS